MVTVPVVLHIDHDDDVRRLVERAFARRADIKLLSASRGLLGVELARVTMRTGGDGDRISVAGSRHCSPPKGCRLGFSCRNSFEGHRLGPLGSPWTSSSSSCSSDRQIGSVHNGIAGNRTVTFASDLRYAHPSPG